MITLTYDLNVYSDRIATSVHLSQYDSNFTLVFNLISSYGIFTMESGTTAKIRFTKPDGNGYSKSGTVSVSDRTVTIAGDNQMTAVAGAFPAEIVLMSGDKELSTVNFMLDIEKAPMDASTVPSESVIEEINAAVDEYMESHDIYVDPTLSISGRPADAKITGDAVNDLKSALNRFSKASTYGGAGVVLELNSGYIRENGLVNTADGTKKEVYTQLIETSENDVWTYVLEYSSQVSSFFAIALYDSTETFISRVTILNNVDGDKWSGDYTVPQNVKYVAFTYRTYGEDPLVVWDEDIQLAYFAKETADAVIDDGANVIYTGTWAEPTASIAFNGNDTVITAKSTGTYRTASLDFDVSDTDYITISWKSKTGPATATGASIRYGFVNNGTNTWKAYLNQPATINVSGVNTVRIGLYVDQLSVTQGATATFIELQCTKTKERLPFTQFEKTAVDALLRLYLPMIQSIYADGNISPINNVVRSVAHRGDDITAPQCTAPAYIVAKKRGFTIAENDLALSSDGEFVMWHDTNLNRLGNLVDINGYEIYTNGTIFYYVNGTNAYTWNGTNYVSASVDISSLTRCHGSNFSVETLPLATLKRIDFGSYKGSQYAGTQILTFAEWVLLCKQLGMEIYVDKKLDYTDELLTQAATIVKNYGMANYSSWLSLNVRQTNLLRQTLPDVRVGTLQHPNAEAIATFAEVNTGRGIFFDGNAKNGMTAEVIRLGLNAGFDVEVYYVDFGSASEETILNTIRQAVSYGVTGMTLDHYRTDDAFKYMLEEY